MQQPQTRPLLGDSVSSTTSPTARRNNPVAVLTHQQLHQLQQLQAQNSTGQPLTFALQQSPGNNGQDQGNVSTSGIGNNHILYLNQLSQLNQSTINSTGTGMGLPPATPTFGVGLNMGLPLSLLNTSLTSLTSNVITTSNPLLNIGIPSLNSALTTVNPATINTINTLNALNTNLSSNSITANGLTAGIGQDLNTTLNRLNTSALNHQSALNNHHGINQNHQFSTLNTNDNLSNLSNLTNITNLNSQNTTNLNNQSHGISTSVNQAFNRTSLNVLTAGLTPSSINSCSTSFPFQTIQSIQSIAPHIVGTSLSNQNNPTSTSIFTSTLSTPPILSTTSLNNPTSNNQSSSISTTTQSINFAGTMQNSNLTNSSTSSVSISSLQNETYGHGQVRQFSQTQNSINQNAPGNTVVKCIQNVNSPGSPFSIPMKSPASNIAPPTPSPSPNRILLRSPASNSMQSNRNSPSPVSMINTSTSGSCTTTTVQQQQQQQQQQNANFTVQLQSPMQSPMSVGPIQSPAPSPYPPAQSPHHQVGGQLSGGSTGNMNNRSPAPGGSPGPTPVVRPNTPILQQGMQVLQIIGTPQGYQQASSQLVTRAALFGNQQIQIATAKPAKQPPQILPKPPNSQQGVATPPKQRATTTITNQVTQQTQPQLVLAGPQQNQTMIPTAQGLLLNQVLPSSGPVIVQQQPGGVQLILRTPTNAQQQTHTAQLTQQQLVRVVTAQGMQLQGITPTFFAVPNGFPPPAPPVMRHTPTSPAPGNSGNNNSIVIQNAMVQSPQSQMNNQITNQSSANNLPQTQSVADQNLLPPPKKKAKKKKKTKKKDDEQPKLDLASIMKISGIGDEDDMFDNDIVPEPEPQIQSLPIQQHVEQQQVTQMTVQHMEQLSPHNSQLSAISNTQQQSVIQSVNANCPTANTTQNPETFGNQMVAQLQMPVQNTISGHLRLAVGEDGRVILHHTPDPNQPEIDQATAQALIRSLTQGTGQNSQIISQLLGHAQSLSQQNIQQQQNLNTNRSKAPAKSSASAGNQTTNQMNPATSAPQMINVQQSQSCTKSTGSFSQQQGNVAGQRSINTCQLTKNNSAIQIAIGSGDGKLSKNEQNVKTISQSNVGHKSHVNACNKKVVGQIFMQSPLQQPNTQRQNYVKTSASNLKMQTGNIVNNRTVQQQIKSPINVQQNRNQQQLEQQQSTDQMNQQQNIQQISTQTVQSLNVQRCLEQNIHKITVSGLQQNSLNILGGNSQQLPESIGQNLEQNIVHGFMDGQTNTSNNCHQDINDIHQQHQQANASLNQQKLNLQNKQQNVIFTSDYPVSSHNTIINTSTGIGQAPKQQQQHQQQQQQQHINHPDILNSAATNILNNAPKITPEILNALSNLNPNDQLLIANANGQMQVISQQLLQQLLTGQLNAQTRATNVNQNQPQKIVIGDADASNSQNLQGVQINTPTSQIIVNSSGGAPTIQNNIQNIVVQAAPSQMPHQIQIQNQAFPSQFIDNLNQQQLRNLSSGNKTTNIVNTNQPVHQLNQSTNVTPPTPTPPVTTKKSRVVKRTKVTVSLANTSGYQTVKTTSRTASVSTSTSTSSASNLSKTAQNCANKNEAQAVGQLGIGRIVTSGIQTVGIQTQTSQSVPQVSVPSNGQMVQRTPRYIQLPVAKQQMLKSIQTQIQSIHSRKQNSPADQALLTKLYQEHNKIVASGKVVSAPSLTIPTQSETTTNAVISSTPSSTPSTPVYTISHPLSATVCKNQQTSTAQTQTMTQTCPVTVANQSLTPLASTSASMPIVHDNSANCISKIDKVQSAMDPSMPTIQTHTINNKTSIEMNKFHQPVTKLTGQYPTTIVTTTCHQSTTVTCQSTQMTQQSTQCQTDPPDIKPNIQMINPIKQELSSPINVQVQVQSASPAGQVIASSPRAICGNKQQQRIQSPVNVSQIKQPLASPSTSTTGTTVQSPRQGIKRPATSPISRQINRSDLMEQQLKIDQNGAINPDVNTPFVSKRDACKRLVRYHCFNEQVLSAKDLAKADEIFEETAKHLLSKFNSMMNKYTYLLLMESMREVRTSELMMIDRTFVAEEQSMLTRLREQEAKASEEFKKEEKPVLPKLETDAQDDEKTTSSTALTNVLVKQELDDDFSCIDSHSSETQMRLKSSSCTSGDYDEWLEIQKELGVYPGESGKCKNLISSSCSGGGSGSNGALSGLSSRTTNKCERTRANGDLRATTSGTCVNNTVTKINYDDGTTTTTTTTMELDKRWCSATDLERDLLEDTDSLDDLALQSHCPGTSLQDNDNDGNELINDQDDITAQVQSAIDSILNLKKRPSSVATTVNTSCVTTTSVTTTQTTISNSSDTKDSVLDQAVRSILGS